MTITHKAPRLLLDDEQASGRRDSRAVEETFTNLEYLVLRRFIGTLALDACGQ